MPRVSVIIPVYNAERMVGTAIGSVLDQTFPDVEVVVVDDGSTDGTGAVVIAFGPRVRCVRQSNAGPAAARNVGLRHAAGEIIAFLDADDAWEPEFLTEVVGALDRHPSVDVASAWATYVDDAGCRLPAGLRPRLASDPLAQALTEGCFLLLPMLAVRRAALDRVGHFDPGLRQAEDWDLLLRLAASGVRFFSVERILVRKRLRGDSLTADPEQVLRWSLDALGKASARISPGSPHRALAARMRATLLLRASANLWRVGARDPAVHRFAEGLEAWPTALHRPEVHLGILIRLLPPGRRTEGEVLRALDSLAGEVIVLVDATLAYVRAQGSGTPGRRRSLATVHAVLAALFARRGAWGGALRHGARALVGDPLALAGLALHGLTGSRSRGTPQPSGHLLTPTAP